MCSEELYRLIGNAENKIWSNQKKIKQLESIYEDLLTLKRGLGNVLSRHAEVCAKNKTAMEDAVFSSNQCMKRFRDSFSSMLTDSSTAGPGGSISSAVDTVSEKATAVLKEIDEIDAQNDELRRQIKVYTHELYELAAVEDVQGG